MAHIAVIDDDEDITSFFESLLLNEGYRVSCFSSVGAFLGKIQESPALFDLVLCDYRLPDGNGLQLFRQAKQKGLQRPYFLMTAFGDFEVAVEAMKAGVADYLIKPIKKEVLVQKVRSCLERSFLEEEVLFNRLDKNIVAHSVVMQNILHRISRVASSKASILLTGESGVGKEVLTRMLHGLSPRSKGSFVPVNASAIPETLFEAQFFGYRKGAFTGAIADHDGYAQAAHEGTLFLDEVGELPIASQAKLLRLIEERRVRPIGSKKPLDVDFRLVCATSKDLESAVKKGLFREDLYYRIAVVSIRIPPLRERPEDILPLARFLLNDLTREEGLEILDFTPEAQETILAYPWPGNVREMKNRIHEAILSTDKKFVDAKHLHLTRNQSSKAAFLFPYEQARLNFEKRYIKYLMKSARGNISRAAELSKLSRKAIYDLLKRHDLSPEAFRETR